MSPEEKIEMGRKLIAEAEAEIAAKKRNWPEKIEPGMVFQDDASKWIAMPATGRPPVDTLVSLSSGHTYALNGLFNGKESEFTYIGHARDIIKIADDAREPTGAELVGKACQFSDDGKRWTLCAAECGGYDESKGDHRYAQGRVFAWKYARLA
jgi:hypothetical protein